MQPKSLALSSFSSPLEIFKRLPGEAQARSEAAQTGVLAVSDSAPGVRHPVSSVF